MGQFFKILCLAIVTMSCKTTTSASQNQSSTDQGHFVCEKPIAVQFEAPPKETTPTAVKNAAVSLGVLDYFNIEVKPDDFKNLLSQSCNENGLCNAELVKPVKVNVNVPVTLLSKVKLTYEQANETKPGVCFKKAVVGTSIGTPICLGNIINASINLGVGIKKTDDLNTRSTTYNAEPYCNAKFSCNLPFFSASAKLDQNGITFSTDAGTKTGLGTNLIKVGASTSPSKSYTLPFPQWPEPVRKLKEYFAGKNQGAKLTAEPTPDIAWENLALTCAL